MPENNAPTTTTANPSQNVAPDLSAILSTCATLDGLSTDAERQRVIAFVVARYTNNARR